MTEADELYADLIRERRYNELLEQFYRDEGENIFNLVLHTVCDHATAQDWVQESFIKLHRYVRHLRSPESYRFWAYRITVNTCKTHLRECQKQNRRTDGQIDASEVADGQVATPEEQLLQQSTRQMVQYALAQLTPEYRTAVLLHYYHGHKYEEIATILSLPLNTVKSQIHRGKQQLSRYLWRKKVEDAVG